MAVGDLIAWSPRAMLTWQNPPYLACAFDVQGMRFFTPGQAYIAEL